MPKKTDNHEYEVPQKGEKNWDEPLNENIERYDAAIEIRDAKSNRGDYTPKAGAKFLATDTEEVFVGDGSSWNRLATRGRRPTFEELNPGEDFLGVGRSDPITLNEAFGVRADAERATYGGMYLDTSGAQAKPFYGYATGGATRAWHYYDGADDEWRLNVDGIDVLSATAGGVEASARETPMVGTTNGGVDGSAGVRGVSTKAAGSGDFTAGVYGTHREAGPGVYGESEGDDSVGVEGQASGFQAIGVKATAFGQNSRALEAHANSPNLAISTVGHVRFHGNVFVDGEDHTIVVDGDAEVAGDLNVDGNKNFVQSVDTEDGEKDVVYTASEAGTPHTEASGVAELEDGRAEVDLPEHFGWVTDPDEPIVVQITPYGGTAGTKVAERSTRRIVVEDLDGEGDYEFAYTVKGTREGQADKEVVREPRATSDGDEFDPAPADD